MSHAEVRLEGCHVPADAMLGQPGDGFAIAQSRLAPGRIHHCMRWIGICDRAFELLCRYAASRELAPGEPLADRQIVQAWIADSRADIDSAALLVMRAAWTIDVEGAREALASPPTGCSPSTGRASSCLRPTAVTRSPDPASSTRAACCSPPR